MKLILSLCSAAITAKPYQHSTCHLYIHAFLHTAIHLCIHSSIHPSIHASMRPSIHACFHYSSTHPFIHLTTPLLIPSNTTFKVPTMRYSLLHPPTLTRTNTFYPTPPSSHQTPIYLTPLFLTPSHYPHTTRSPPPSNNPPPTAQHPPITRQNVHFSAAYCIASTFRCLSSLYLSSRFSNIS